MFPEQNIFRIITDLFLAGSETTSVSLDWAMMFMTEFPKTQKKCQDEIEKVSRFSVLNWYISSTSILNHIPEYMHIYTCNGNCWSQKYELRFPYDKVLFDVCIHILRSVIFDFHYKLFFFFYFFFFSFAYTTSPAAVMKLVVFFRSSNNFW